MPPSTFPPPKAATRRPATWWDSFTGGSPGKNYFVSNGISGIVYYEMGFLNGEQKRRFVQGYCRKLYVKHLRDMDLILFVIATATLHNYLLA